jgi:hypothetical protein
VKAALAGQYFPGPENLLIGIQEFLNEIQRSELELVFHYWINYGQKASPTHFSHGSKEPFQNPFPPEAALLQQEIGDMSSVPRQARPPKAHECCAPQATAGDISADHCLSIRVAAAKRRREEMVWGTK